MTHFQAVPCIIIINARHDPVDPDDALGESRRLSGLLPIDEEVTEAGDNVAEVLGPSPHKKLEEYVVVVESLQKRLGSALEERRGKQQAVLKPGVGMEECDFF